MTKYSEHPVVKALKPAVIATLPVFFGYIFAGVAFGILFSQKGYGVLWALLIALTVYAGSMQFVMVGFFDGGLSLLTVALMTLAVNIRHAFYGLSFIERFDAMGRAKPYMIFSLTDETYSLLSTLETPAGVDEKTFSFLVAILNQSYWVLGCVLGATAGALITFNTTGIDFAMTALFIVIFVEQWLSAENHAPAFIGLVSACVSLVIFGPEHFILPSLLATVCILMLMRNQLEMTEKVTE